MSADFRKTPAPGTEAERRIAEALSLTGAAAGLLAGRGFHEPEECRKFLFPSTEDLSDPFLMKDMDRAVAAVRRAAAGGRKILVYGDFDADGITASALLVRSFRGNGIPAEYYIPHRLREGYGLNESALERAASSGTGLVVTVDCGITSIREVIRARRLGMDVVITDHHEPASLALPPAEAVVNPMQSGCRSPFKNLSGAGIAFKLAWALFGKEYAMKHIDLAAIGTVADVCSLTMENRAIVKFGLEELSRATKPGTALLLEKAGTGRRGLGARDLSFILGPRLNAPGRLASARSSAELLITDDPAEAAALAASLETDNLKRRKLQKEILESALRKIEPAGLESLIVLSDDEWHPGLIGIIASKISELHSRPAVLIATGGEYARGSARSVEGFHILSALSEFGGIIHDLGGHAMAAGFSLKRRNVPGLIRKIKSIRVDPDKLKNEELPAAERVLALPEITEKLLAELKLFEPFGEGNPEPVFMAEDIVFSGVRRLKNGHLKMKASSDSRAFDCIGFGMFTESVKNSRQGRIHFTPGINEWNGKREIQLKLKGIYPVG